MPDGPEPVCVTRPGNIDRDRPRLGGASGQRDALAQGFLLISLELDQQESPDIRANATRRAMRWAYKVEEASVQQLQRGRRMLIDRLNNRMQVVERRELYPHTRTELRHGVQSPFNPGYDAQRSLGTNDEVEHITRGEIRVYRIAGGVFPDSGKPAGHERSCGSQ